MQVVLNELLQYGIKNALITEADFYYVANQLIEVLELTTFERLEISSSREIHEILNELVDDAIKRGVCEEGIDYRDLFDTKLMNCLMPRPSEVIKTFEHHYSQSAKQATDAYYDLSKASNYIRMDRIAKNMTWKTKTQYGNLDLTVNLSKPEKDPKAIAAAKLIPAPNYPKCLLCKENEGFSGSLKHPARQNHRMIPITLQNELWYLQYSPYVYYNEHCIVLKAEHEPMKITSATFERLLSFVSQFPHYFIGSNADLPIVGGSILTHDHFQGGHYTFAMDEAKDVMSLTFKGFEEVSASFLYWPLSVIRLRHENRHELVRLGEKILTAWRNYSDESLMIKAYSDDVPHHTITPIARYRNNQYELDLVLRDNQVSDKHPDGIYHPHAQYHHLKKENIGLIEVMGLAVLPGRLKMELEVVKQAFFQRDATLLNQNNLEKHSDWLQALLEKYEQISEDAIDAVLKKEVGLKFVEILACCGVYKQNEKGYNGVKGFVKNVNDM